MRVVKINAGWCSGCLVMNRLWKKVIQKYPMETIELDYDMDEEEVSKYSPGDVLPVLIFFEGDQEIFRVVGEKKEKELFSIVEGLVD